jgi:hypothetical protein
MCEQFESGGEQQVEYALQEGWNTNERFQKI